MDLFHQALTDAFINNNKFKTTKEVWPCWHKKLYEHSSVSVAKKEQLKLMQGMAILTNKCFESNHSGITFVRKSSYACILTDLTMPQDKKIVKVEQMKIQKYQSLTGQIREMFQVAVGALGTFYIKYDAFFFF